MANSRQFAACAPDAHSEIHVDQETRLRQFTVVDSLTLLTQLPLKFAKGDVRSDDELNFLCLDIDTITGSAA